MGFLYGHFCLITGITSTFIHIFGARLKPKSKYNIEKYVKISKKQI